MPKNIVVFSDGTGQDGGVRPEQRVSNVYKMYRVCKVGPESGIDPSEQVAFYDPGLGTDIGATAVTAPVRFAQKLLASVSGRGIAANIADCYRFILDHHEPGDRIFLIGFSRGAYTMRCVANLLMYCGVPTRGAAGPLLRFRRMTREIAREAVEGVLEFGAGSPRAAYDAERSELARRFRARYGSGHPDDPRRSNAEPHFIGTFDTVAALGVAGPKRAMIQAGLAALVAVPSLLVIALAAALAGWRAAAALLAAEGAAALLILWRLAAARTRTIADWPGPGQSRRCAVAWKGENFDRLLSDGVAYARAAVAIDERRRDFARVAWGPTGSSTRAGQVPEQLRQVWFAGNHSDIGGSYDEAESRLSDIALGWMIEEAVGVPGGLKVDGLPPAAEPGGRADAARIPRLRLHPSAGGMQHCEVAGMSDSIAARVAAPWVPGWLRRAAGRLAWEVADRAVPPSAPLHPSVVERLALPSVVQCDGAGPYRPAALRGHAQFRAYDDRG